MDLESLLVDWERVNIFYYNSDKCFSQFGWSAIATLTIISSICSRAENEEYAPEVLFLEVLWLYGTSSTDKFENSNHPLELQFRATALVVLLCLDSSVAPGEEHIVSHVVHL